MPWYFRLSRGTQARISRLRITSSKSARFAPSGMRMVTATSVIFKRHLLPTDHSPPNGGARSVSWRSLSARSPAPRLRLRRRRLGLLGVSADRVLQRLEALALQGLHVHLVVIDPEAEAEGVVLLRVLRLFLLAHVPERRL